MIFCSKSIHLDDSFQGFSQFCVFRYQLRTMSAPVTFLKKYSKKTNVTKQLSTNSAFNEHFNINIHCLSFDASSAKQNTKYYKEWRRFDSRRNVIKINWKPIEPGSKRIE